jgi:hypothetical protein
MKKMKKMMELKKNDVTEIPNCTFATDENTTHTLANAARWEDLKLLDSD